MSVVLQHNAIDYGDDGGPTYFVFQADTKEATLAQQVHEQTFLMCSSVIRTHVLQVKTPSVPVDEDIAAFVAKLRHGAFSSQKKLPVDAVCYWCETTH